MQKFFVTLFLTISLNTTAQNWISPGGGVNNDIRSFYVDTVTDRLIALGKFTVAGSVSAKGIAAWDGTAWDSLSSYGVIPGQEVWAATRYNGNLYAIGPFWNSIYDYYFVQWNGSGWTPLQNLGFNAPGGFIEYNGELLCYGIFDTLGTTPCSKIARWDGSQWQPFDTTVWDISGINSAVVYNGDLYIAGNFSNLNLSPPARNIARWDGTSWHSVPGCCVGSMSSVGDLEIFNGELYVAGMFSILNGNPSTSIAKWNGTTWSDVGGGMGGTTYPTAWDMEIFNGKLYVVGQFTTAGGVPAQYIAAWDGTNWCGLGSVFDNYNIRLKAYNNELYIAGGFWSIDGDSLTRVAKWTAGNYVDTCGNTTGADELIAPIPSVKVFPNPFSGKTTFQLSGLNGSVTIRVFDALGREMWQMQSREDRIEFSAEGYASGLYHYRVEQDGEVRASGKLVVQ